MSANYVSRCTTMKDHIWLTHRERNTSRILLEELLVRLATILCNPLPRNPAST